MTRGQIVAALGQGTVRPGTAACVGGVLVGRVVACVRTAGLTVEPGTVELGTIELGTVAGAVVGSVGAGSGATAVGGAVGFGCGARAVRVGGAVRCRGGCGGASVTSAARSGGAALLGRTVIHRAKTAMKQIDSTTVDLRARGIFPADTGLPDQNAHGHLPPAHLATGQPRGPAARCVSSTDLTDGQMCTAVGQRWSVTCGGCCLSGSGLSTIRVSTWTLCTWRSICG